MFIGDHARSDGRSAGLLAQRTPDSESRIEVANLEVRDLSISIRGRSIVDGLSFSVGQGRRVCLLGASGSGKSLTASAILGLLPADAVVSGSIHINGIEVCGVPLSRRSDLTRTAMVFQDSAVALNPLTRLREQIAEPLRRHRGMTREEAVVAAIALAESVGLPEPEVLLSGYSGELSGGQRQRVCIAIALACSSSLLIADEPTTALDVVTQQRVLEVLRKRTAGAGMPAMLLITHDLIVAAQLCTDAVVVSGGRAVERETMDNILAHPEHAYTRELVAAMQDSTRLSLSSPIADTLPQHDRNRRKDTLLVKGVSRSYRRARIRPWAVPPSKVALAPTSLELKAGERVGIVGVSGSGKTTLLKLLLALDPPDTGTIVYDGWPVAPARAKRLRWYRRRVQYVPQDPASTLDPWKSVQDLVTEPLVRLSVSGDHPTMLRAALASVGLDETFLDRRPGELSGGQAQRVAIARAVATRPDLLIADEPVSGLDLPLRQHIVTSLRQISRERGTGLLVVSHDLSVVADLCERTLVMADGAVVESRRTIELLAAPQHPSSQELIDAVTRLRAPDASPLAR